MEANGNVVVVVSPDGRTLRTETLKYDNATNTISTDVPFVFDRGDEHLEGNSFRSDPDFRNVVTDSPRGRAGERACCCRDRSSRRDGMAGTWPSARQGRGASRGEPRHVRRPGPGLGAGARSQAAPWQACRAGRDAARQAEASTRVPTLRLPDRQRGPARRGQRDAQRHQLLRRRQRPAALPRHPDHDAERQRGGLRRQRRAVHRQREVPRLDASRWTPTAGTYYKNGERWEARGHVVDQQSRNRLDADRTVARLLPGGARACATRWRCSPSGRPTISYADGRLRREAGASPTSSSATGCASRATTGSGPAAR